MVTLCDHMDVDMRALFQRNERNVLAPGMNGTFWREIDADPGCHIRHHCRRLICHGNNVWTKSYLLASTYELVVVRGVYVPLQCHKAFILKICNGEF
jgi:hypothetical protein